MKQKLKGILSLTAICSMVLTVIIGYWKEILVGAGMTVLAVLAAIVLIAIVLLIGTGASGEKWDKD